MKSDENLVSIKAKLLAEKRKLNYQKKDDDAKHQLAKSVKEVLDMYQEFVQIDELEKPEYYSREQIEGRKGLIIQSLNEYGFIAPIHVNKREDGRKVIIEGFQRCMAWKSLGNDQVPVIYHVYDLEREKDLHLHLNQQEFDYNLEKVLEFFEYWTLEKFDLLAPDALPDDPDHHKKTHEKSLSAKEEGEDCRKAIVNKRFIVQKEDNLRFLDLAEKVKVREGLKNQSELFIWMVNFCDENC